MGCGAPVPGQLLAGAAGSGAGRLERRREHAAAEREDAEEAFGDYQLALEALKDRLTDVRDAYAATLEDPEPYEGAFERAAVRRWPDIEAV